MRNKGARTASYDAVIVGAGMAGLSAALVLGRSRRRVLVLDGTGHPLPTPQESPAALDLDPTRWRSERLAAPERRATGPSGEPATVTDNIIALTRLAP